MNTENEKNNKIVVGKVVSKKMQKTIVVEVLRVFRHPMYGKVLRLKKNFKVHDNDGVAKLGDWVSIVECAPVSKTKHMMLKSILQY